MSEATLQQDAKPSQRYELIEELGGGQTATFLARERDTGERVVVKWLDVRQSDEWKAIDLFEREVEVLRGLDHPAIPRLVDAFVEDEDGQTARLYLVQECVEGTDLARAVDDGYRVDEDEARQMARELLGVLGYLHSQDPPVVHRDVKPANIVRGEDGRLHLVDFGAVGRFVSNKGGSTVIGTAGYVPTEQLAGRAEPASDLYALGATLVFMLSRRPPSELPLERMRLRFREATNVSEDFAQFIDGLLAPSAADRPQNAARALELLDAPSPTLPVPWSGSGANLPRKYRPPKGSKLTMERRPGRLEVRIPGGMSPYLLMLPFACVVLIGQALILSFTASPIEAIIAGLLALLFGVLTLIGMKIDVRLMLTPEHFQITYGLFNREWTKTVPTEEFRGLEVVRWSRNHKPALEIRGFTDVDVLGVEVPFKFGRGLNRAECHWLANLFETESQKLLS